MTNSELVTYTISDGVAHVTLNRPDRLNALNADVFSALVEVGLQLRRNDSGASVVVLSGAGRAFCAGLDFDQFAVMGEGRNEVVVHSERLGAAKALAQQAVHVWSLIDQPVIAAVHGYALGGGLQIALGADIRVVDRDAKLSVMEVKWGLIPDMMGTQLLPELVGRDVAKDLTFTGRTVTGEQAHAMGLATRLSDDAVNDSLALAVEIAAHSPAALRHAKRLLEMAGRVDLTDGLDAEQAAIGELIGSDEQVEVVRKRLAQK